MQTLRRKISLLDVTEVTLYTGNNDSSKCTCKCPCCTQTERKGLSYQGTIEQANELFHYFPNLKQLYVLGNPDVSVDSVYCNYVMKKAIERNIHVAFSTSGIGGKKTLKLLLDGIFPEMVDYISFSIDSVNKEKMSFLKGVKYPWDYAMNGIDWALNQGFKVKIQPTLWFINANDIEEIIEYFYPKGINWYTIHIGSLENGINLPTHKHLTLKQLEYVHNQLERITKKYNITVKCPIIFPELGNNDCDKWYCMKKENQESIQAIFSPKGIICTPAPIASSLANNLDFKLEKNIYEYEVNLYEKSDICPFSKKMTGEYIDTFCRYVCRIWQS